MVFTSWEFLFFFIAFFFLYWFVFNRQIKSQNIFLLLGSYFFFAWWDWRFLSLIIASSIINYVLGIQIEKNENKRRLFVLIGLIQGVGMLFFFKYYNFFIDSLVQGLSKFNITTGLHTLNLILPLGISFYTFRTISYLLDVDSGKIKATKDPIVFFNFVAFFPSLSAGPIDKARNFIPQLENKRVFTYDQATNGLGQILWGLFKKLVIANNCESFTSKIGSDSLHFPGSTLFIAAIFNTIQIYADFSGYSDMAIGTGKLLGFRLTRNFNVPFFAQNIADFWQRWHISLTSWMTEYVFTPLSFVFRRLHKPGLILAIVVNFILVGLWHGANWTFIVFGLLNGCYFIPLILSGKLNKRKEDLKLVPSPRQFYNIACTFLLVSLTNIVFFSPTVPDAFNYYSKLFSGSLFAMPKLPNKLDTIILLSFMLFEWIGKNKEYPVEILLVNKNKFQQWATFYFIAMVIFLFANKGSQFVYAQF